MMKWRGGPGGLGVLDEFLNWLETTYPTSAIDVPSSPNFTGDSRIWSRKGCISKDMMYGREQGF